MAKQKKCKWCEETVDKLWFSSPPTCMKPNCRRQGDAERRARKGEKQKTKINPISESKAKDLAKYRPLRDKYMSEHLVCECCQIKPATDLHHKKPRAYYLCDISVFCALCRECHNRCESDHEWARRNSLKIDHL